MGGSISINSDDAATDGCEPAPAHSDVTDIDCNISDAMRQNMHEAISEAHATTARADLIVLPWEMPSMSWIFGETSPLDFPSIAPVMGYMEPGDEPTDSRTEHAMPISSRGTFFESAIAFNSFRTCHLDEGSQLALLAQKWEGGSQLALLAQKWEGVISINYAAFNLGIEIFEMPHREKVVVASEVLGGKSPATLSRRLSQISRYVRWATEDAKRLPFPVSGELIKNYVRHLRNASSAHTAFKGFIEVLKFMKHVVGLDCDLSAFDSAWVNGVIRSAQQARPLRKQSTTLNVKTVQYLENFLFDQTNSMVDRYAAGVFLFAIFSRARFGDLRRIAKIIIDPATEDSDGSLGYLEMHSASHKMRATGNRLGAHLPLIAPIKGLGPRAWGKDFVDIAKRVGLDLHTWVSDRPLLPAPTQVGDWTDRAVTSHEIGKWMIGILTPCKDFDPSGFTPHGLILSHHQLHKGALEVYARDLQSAPLRVLEKMFSDIRNGRFSPDLTRSGMFAAMDSAVTFPAHAVGDVSPAPTTPLAETPSESPGWDVMQGTPALDSEVTDKALPTETLTEDVESDVSESEFGSDESSAEDVIRELATSKRPTGHWHPGCVALSGEYQRFETRFFVDAMKCQQCNKGHAPSAEGQQLEALGNAVKRARRS
eukprot:s1019_g9.t1